MRHVGDVSRSIDDVHGTGVGLPAAVHTANDDLFSAARICRRVYFDPLILALLGYVLQSQLFPILSVLRIHDMQ